LWTQQRWPRVFGHTSSIACQKHQPFDGLVVFDAVEEADCSFLPSGVAPMMTSRHWASSSRVDYEILTVTADDLLPAQLSRSRLRIPRSIGDPRLQGAFIITDRATPTRTSNYAGRGGKQAIESTRHRAQSNTRRDSSGKPTGAQPRDRPPNLHGLPLSMSGSVRHHAPSRAWVNGVTSP
jgi:hypothetical protein